MNPETGYYSLIQYCPDPSRLEAANVGVLLFSPKHCFLKALTARSNSRIRRFFGDKGHDGVRLNSFKKGLEERIEAENANIHTLDDLKRFVHSRAGQLQLTPPRYMRVVDPERDLRQLFDELVGGQSRSEPQTNLRRFLG